jgi:rhamnogalacturonan endolyase
LGSLSICLGVFLASGSRLEAAFGVTTSGGLYTVDTGAGLIFKVNTSDGSIRSIKYNNGPELQNQSSWSHIASGYGPVTSTASNLNGVIKITCQTSPSNSVVKSLTHYFLVRSNVNTIYMASYLTQQPSVGEFRWITRLDAGQFPNRPVPSNIEGSVGNVESADVKWMPDGTTRSKYYGDTETHGKDRAMDLSFCGISRTGTGVWMVYDRRESASGGPFYRDIQNQSTEVYNYMNSGHAQTEAPRTNVLHGPYALVFTPGTEPMLPVDFNWIESANLGLTGFVPRSGRGAVQGTTTGISASFQTVVGFHNASAQYWTIATNGTYLCPNMKPGTYTVKLYKGELAVATTSTTVSAGVTNTVNLVSTESQPAYIFKIGEWDGTPAGFLNYENLIKMHPGDPRQSPWGPLTYTVESNAPSDFPAIQFRLANTPTTIRFNLTAAQAATSHNLKIGITVALYGGRPYIKVNNKWTSSTPAASSQPEGRNFTLGTWRGNNATFTYNIPSSAFVTGPNFLTIHPNSGSSDLGTWLSAGWVYDCVVLEGTPTAPLVPAQLTAAPGDSKISLTWNQSPNATSYKIKRAPTSGGPYTVIGTNVVASFTDTGVTNGTLYHYVVSAVNSVGESGNSGEAVAIPVGVINTPNFSFESPATADWVSPGTVSWTFAPKMGNSGAGVAANGSAFTSSNPGAPDGAQVAFLQSTGTISQPLTGFIPGMAYRVTFTVAHRNRTTQTTNQSFDVRIDGVTKANFSPALNATNYVDRSCLFTATSGAHTLAFVGLRAQDTTAFLDNVRVQQVAAPPGGLLWAGDGISNTWNLNSAANWLNGATLTTFTNNAPVVFDDNGQNSPAINLLGVLQPASVTVAANQNYTFGGTGSLAGSGSLRKSGQGSLTLTHANSFSGGTTNHGGDIIIQNSGALGSGPVTVTASDTATVTRLVLTNGITMATPLVINGRNTAYNGVVYVPGANDSATVSGSITVNSGVNGTGGTLRGPDGSGLLSVTGPLIQGTAIPAIRNGNVRLSGGGSGTDLQIMQGNTSLGAMNGINSNATVTLAISGNTVLNLNGFNQTVAGLVESAYVATVTNSSGATATLTVNAGTDGGFDGRLAGNLNFAKSGAGTFTLTGSNNFTGSTVIHDGTLALGAVATTLTVGNAEFEVPAVADGTYNTFTITNGSWDFTLPTPGESGGSAGVANGTTTWGSSRADGGQYCYIWRSGMISQDIFLPAGTCTLNFALAGRPNKTPVDLEFRIASGGVTNTVAVWPSAAQTSDWLDQTTNFAVATPGIYKLIFAARQPAGASDWGSTLDGVEIISQGNVSPALPAATIVSISSAGTLDLAGLSQTIGGLSDAIGGGLVTNSGIAPVTLMLNNTGSNHFGGVIHDGGAGQGIALVKQGAGMQVLSGNSTLSGGVTVNAGTLLVHGQLQNSGVIANAGKLGGDGIIAGVVSVNPGAKLSPGASIGQLTFGSSLTLAAGSTTLMELSKLPLTNDTVNVTGTLNLGGTLIVTNLGGAALAAGDSFQLFTAGSFSGNFAAVTLPSLGAGLFWNTNQLASQGWLSIGSPEPPLITGVSVVGGNLIFSGTGGTPGGSYFVLTSTNVALPVANWTRILTNTFDALGNFSVTNVINPAVSQGYYHIQMQ